MWFRVRVGLLVGWLEDPAQSPTVVANVDMEMMNSVPCNAC